ncbi:uncharacterized protein LOC17895410 [Capsella rubella]|uniref:uncharacterized protein LOC17895410 n=1 Tax=Capsella rubella TaxID=81985 RepID=UPI000CD52ABA|nr:uncharacterized protein LOC17895410 [Capsella rubella]
MLSMTKITMMMVMMMALVLLIGVRAKTMTESECKGTDCKFDCKGLNWVNGMYWNPRMCYYGCSGPCGRDLNCRQRCKKCCHWHTPGASSTMN